MIDLAMCDLPFGDNDRGKCAWCGLTLIGRQTRWCSRECSRAWANNHFWTQARAAARKRDGYRCVRCRSRRKIEVHHKVPCEGKRETGCQHHQDNLETLCHRCHVREHKRAAA